MNKGINVYQELGLQSVYLPYEYGVDGLGNRTRTCLIEDIELAHDMALAMDPVIEQVIEQRTLVEELRQKPDATYRMIGKKAMHLTELIETQKAIEDKRGEGIFGYYPLPSTEGYVRREVSRSVNGESWNGSHVKLLPKSKTRITNSFVASLQEKALERTQQKADNIAERVYFKQKTRENIAILEQKLSQHDKEVFQRIKPHKDDRHTYIEEEEAQELDARCYELTDIYIRKRIVESIASTLGRKTVRGFTRQNLLELASIIDENTYQLRLS